MTSYKSLQETETSLYVHWPFCLSKCPYCDFNSHVSQEIDEKQWLNAYLEELRFFEKEFSGKLVKSVFFGGGTPSLMPPKIVSEILANLNLSSDVEITLEANPTSVEISKFEKFQQAGINRVSLGIQSFNDQSLKFLGRQHSSNEAKESLKVAKQVFDRFSFDLIYALPNQKFSDFQIELEKAMEIADDHISLYQLTIEKATPFFKMHRDGNFSIPDQEESLELYFKTNDFLKDFGFFPYEISNYSKNNAHSIHNMNYWQYGNYVGIGPGAHGRVNGRATMAIHSPKNWLNAVMEKSTGLQHDRILSKREILDELLIMNLRVDHGISNEICQYFFKMNWNEIWPNLQDLEKEGLLKLEKTLKATDRGKLILGSLSGYLSERAFIDDSK